MNRFKMFFAAVALLCAGAAAQAATGHEAAGTLSARECAARKWQLFYYYLEPKEARNVKDITIRCPGGDEHFLLPPWMEKAVPEMAAAAGPDEAGGKSSSRSENQQWQAPASILYEFLTVSGDLLAEGGWTSTANRRKFMEAEFIFRLGLSLRGLDRSALEGRGGEILSDFHRMLAAFDDATDALDRKDRDAYSKAVDEVVSLAGPCFGRLFAKPAGEAGQGYRYHPRLRLEPGYRGFTIAVPLHQMLYVKAGDRLDVLVSFEALMKGGNKETVTATFLQNVVVISTYDPKDGGKTGAVELMLNPNEAQYMALSQMVGKDIYLSLRAAGDVQMHPMEMASFRKLFK